MGNEDLLRRILVAASGVVYWGGVLIQARRVRRHIGRSPNLRPRGMKERLLWAGWLLVILAWILQPLVLSTQVRLGVLKPFAALETPFAFAAGVLLLLAGYAGTLWCYVAMGDAWRIGVNQ